MCNLSFGIAEANFAQGIEQGDIRRMSQIVLALNKNGMSVEQISKNADLPLDIVKSIVEASLSTK